MAQGNGRRRALRLGTPGNAIGAGGDDGRSFCWVQRVLLGGFPDPRKDTPVAKTPVKPKYDTILIFLLTNAGRHDII